MPSKGLLSAIREKVEVIWRDGGLTSSLAPSFVATPHVSFLLLFLLLLFLPPFSVLLCRRRRPPQCGLNVYGTYRKQKDNIHHSKDNNIIFIGISV